MNTSDFEENRAVVLCSITILRLSEDVQAMLVRNRLQCVLGLVRLQEPSVNQMLVIAGMDVTAGLNEIKSALAEHELTLGMPLDLDEILNNLRRVADRYPPLHSNDTPDE